MGVLCVTEFRGLAKQVNRGSLESMDVPEAPPLAEHTIEIGPEAKPSPPFSVATYLIMIKCVDGRCSLAFGKSADARLHIVEEGERLFYGVQPGSFISVVEA